MGPKLEQRDPYNQNQYLNSAVGGLSSGSEDSSSLSFGSGTGGIEGINSLFTKLGLLGNDVSSSSILSNIMSLGSGSMEGLLNRVNKFDSLKCIPRLLCQTIARRQQDAGTSTTERPRKKFRDGKTVKFQGMDTALEQLVT
jgi:hypothetical protein